MASRSLEIIEEFAQSIDAADRKNAAAAYGALQTSESIARLAKIALAETDLTVRRHAEKEALALKGSALNEVISELLRALTDRASLNKQIKVNAYGLLGRLKAAGHEIQLPSLPFLDRLRLAFSVNKYLYHPRRWRYDLRGLKGGLFGGLIGALFTLLLCLILVHWDLNEDNIFGIGLLSIAAFAAALVSGLAVQRVSPINLQFDRVTGVIAEFIYSAFLITIPALILSALYVLIIKLMGKPFSASALLRLGSFWLFMGLLAGVIRLGTALSAGTSTRKIFIPLRQIFIGLAFGVLALILADYFLPLRNLRHDDDEVIVTSNKFLQYLVEMFSPTSNVIEVWLVLIPLFCGLAYAFASIDLESAISRPIFSRAARIVARGVGIVFAALLVATVFLGLRVKWVTLPGYESILGFSADSKYLVATDYFNQSIVLWELNSREIARKFDFARRLEKVNPSGQGLNPKALAISPDAQRLALGDDRGEIYVLDFQPQKLSASHRQSASGSPQLNEEISCLAFSPGGQQVISGHNLGIIKVWASSDAGGGEAPSLFSFVLLPVRSRTSFPTRVESIVFRDDSPTFLAVRSDRIEEFDFQTLNSLGVKVQFESLPDSLAVSSNGKYLATLYPGAEIKFWDLQNGKVIWTIPDQHSQAEAEAMRTYRRSLILSRDGSLLAIGNGPIGFELWETKTPRRLLKSDFDIASFNSLAISPDNKLLAASNYSFIRLWELDKLIK